MHWFIPYSDAIVYSLSFSMMLGAAYFILQIPSISNSYQDLDYRFYVQKLKKNIYASFNNHRAEKIFREAGYPLHLTGFRFSLLKGGLLLLTLLFFTGKMLIQNGPINLYPLFWGIAFLLATSTGEYSLLSYLLNKLAALKNKEKNKECFLLYSMLLNEFNIVEDRPFNLYSILQRFSLYFEHIKPALLKSLAIWKRNPDEALELFATEVGTPEARDLSIMLKAVDLTVPANARDIIKSRYEQFQTSRHEHHRRTMKTKDLIGYIIFFIPTLAILFNMVFVLGLAVQNLLVRLNSR